VPLRLSLLNDQAQVIRRRAVAAVLFVVTGAAQADEVVVGVVAPASDGPDVRRVGAAGGEAPFASGSLAGAFKGGRVDDPHARGQRQAGEPGAVAPSPGGLFYPRPR
jgi:predicted MFS family arabinose efflux permease